MKRLIVWCLKYCQCSGSYRIINIISSTSNRIYCEFVLLLNLIIHDETKSTRNFMACIYNQCNDRLNIAMTSLPINEVLKAAIETNKHWKLPPVINDGKKMTGKIVNLLNLFRRQSSCFISLENETVEKSSSVASFFVALVQTFNRIK